MQTEHSHRRIADKYCGGGALLPFCWIIAACYSAINSLIMADWPLHYIIQNFKHFPLPLHFNDATCVIPP